MIYLAQVTDRQIKVFGWVSGDEQKVLKENGVLLNIMRIRYMVMVELSITFIICVLVIGCNVFKKLSKGDIVNESNRCD